jgi:hypothetical protein
MKKILFPTMALVAFFSLALVAQATSPELGVTLKTSAKVPYKPKPIVITLDDSNPENGSGQYDFETRRKTTTGSIDISIGGIIFDNQWLPAMNWSVIEMPTSFDDTKKCPIRGYASVDDPDGDGFGTPRYGNPGKVFCLKTAEGNFAKLEVLSATYDDKNGRVFQFKYLFNLRKIRSFK